MGKKRARGSTRAQVGRQFLNAVRSVRCAMHQSNNPIPPDQYGTISAWFVIQTETSNATAKSVILTEASRASEAGSDFQVAASNMNRPTPAQQQRKPQSIGAIPANQRQSPIKILDRALVPQPCGAYLRRSRASLTSRETVSTASSFGISNGSCSGGKPLHFASSS